MSAHRQLVCGPSPSARQPVLAVGFVCLALNGFHVMFACSLPSKFVRWSFVCAALLACLNDSAVAQRPTRNGRTAANGNAADAAPTPRDYRSRNFLVHTDLPPDDAQELLKKLETMLTLISKYWGRPNRQIIECYVVQSLENWPPGVLHPNGVRSIESGGGVTMSQVATLGARFSAKSIVFAGSERGTAQHEAVHAYCAQSFGRTGPVWYSEGMAEMGQYWREDDPGVNCRAELAAYLRQTKRKTVREVVDEPQTTGDSWQNYAWRWALCHMLANNSNYAERFRPLGLALLTGQQASFDQMYGAMLQEIEFEYSFFIDHMAQGYRVDLCSWDWKAKYRQPRGKVSLISKIDARNGWQPSRAEVRADTEYAFETSGEWKLAADAEAITAAGDESGRGQLMGIVFRDFELSAPFVLGETGTFRPPMDGALLLRCRDEWSELVDNSGTVTVRIRTP